MDILVDLNFNYKTEGFLKMARAMEPFDLFWVEIDTRDPKALAYIRSRTTIPVASCECLFGRRDYRPFFEQHSVDVAIIDTPWNGVGESLKIASMADTYEINVAPHNFYGQLATMMSAHFCAVVPNLRIMETDPDMVPWHDDLVTVKPDIEDGHLHLPTGPGWGTEVNEAAVRAHPPARAARSGGAAQIPVPNPPAARTVTPSPMWPAEWKSAMPLSTAARGRPGNPLDSASVRAPKAPAAAARSTASAFTAPSQSSGLNVEMISRVRRPTASRYSRSAPTSICRVSSLTSGLAMPIPKSGRVTPSRFFHPSSQS